jgi:hypothetical protein
MKTILKITVGILLAGTLLVGGCAALVGAGASSVDKDMQRKHDKAAITKTQLASVHMGDSKSAVVAQLGQPDNSQHMESASELGDSTSDCLYYNAKGQDWSDDIAGGYQLCFTDGKLDAKNRW